MSRETISLADQDTIKACQVLMTNQTLTVPSLLNILGKVPGLVQSLAARLEVQYDKTETLRMQVKDLQGKLAQWDAERRGIAVMRDKFGARPGENDAEFITRIHQERIDAQGEVLRLSSDLAMMTERAQGCASGRNLLDEVAKLEGLLNKETTKNARLVVELTEAEIKIGEQAHTLQSRASAPADLRAEIDRQNDRANSAERREFILQGQLRDAQLAMQHERNQHDLMRERAEAAERCAARAEHTSDAALHTRVEALETELRQYKDHPGLPIDVLVYEAYQTAKDKGWHDPADENDVAVIEARQALGREGLRVWRICYIAEKIRKGQAPALQDYLRIFDEVEYRLSASDVRLISDLMLVITEVGEAIDDVLADRMVEGVDEKGKPIGLPSELADVVIRVAHICGHRKIDLAGAVQRKLKFNKTRPHKHGKHA